MTYTGILVLLAMGPTPPPGTVANPKAQMIQQFMLIGFMAIAFYMIGIRPQQKKAKEHAALMKTLKAGDKVVTTSGILGTVISVKEKEGTVSLRSAESKLEVLKSAITEIKERAGTSTAES